MVISLKKMVALWLACALLALGPVVLAQSNGGEDEGEAPDYVREIEARFGVLETPEVLGRIRPIQARLLAVIPEAETDEREIVVRVLDDGSVNAFALPDGHVYLFRGLLEECETNDMLAGVMAHEFTHVFHHHHSRSAERQLRGMLAGVVAMAATGEMEAMLVGQMLAASMVETYGRAAENDADRTGVTRMVEAGYDPLGYLELLQVLEQDAIHRPEPGGNYFTIHPHPDERMANIREALEELGIDVPETVYRVHLPLKLYLPLSELERARLDAWENELVERAEGPDDEKERSSEETYEVPQSLLREYRLRQALFADIVAPESGEYGVVAVGERGVFQLAAHSAEALRQRGEDIISRLGELFLEGLRDYEVQARTVSDEPALVARRRRIATTTESDAALLGLTPEEANSERVETLKDILWRYYVNRRI